MDRRNYDQRLRDQLQEEYNRLSHQQTGAWVIVGVSAALFISNMLGVDEPTNRTPGGLTLAGIIGGGIWLYSVRAELARNGGGSADPPHSALSLRSLRPNAAPAWAASCIEATF